MRRKKAPDNPTNSDSTMPREPQRVVVTSEKPPITTSEASATARATVKLLQKWKLNDGEAREILGGLTARRYERWKAGHPGRIDRDLATRLSLLMGIHTSLHHIFADPERGYAWINSPNGTFGGRSPAEIMKKGDIFSLARVRAYLEAERNG